MLLKKLLIIQLFLYIALLADIDVNENSRAKARASCLLIRIRNWHLCLSQKKSGRYGVRKSRPTGVTLKYRKRGIAKFVLHYYKGFFFVILKTDVMSLYASLKCQI